MKKICLILSIVIAVAIISSCATTSSLAVPTAEEAEAFKSAYSEVLASAGVGGVVNLIGGDDLSSDYKAGDKLGALTVTADSHVKMELDLSGIFQGEQSLRYDIDISYRTPKGTEKSVVYVAETRRGDDGENVMALLKAELNGKAFDPEAMQALL